MRSQRGSNDHSTDFSENSNFGDSGKWDGDVVKKHAANEDKANFQRVLIILEMTIAP